MESFSSFSSHLSTRYPSTTKTVTVQEPAEDLVYKPCHRFHVALVILFAILSITAGVWALMTPACNPVVSTFVKYVTASYAFEVVICSIRFPIARFAKKSRGSWKNRSIRIYDVYSRALHRGLLSYFSVFYHCALVIWGIVEVNVCGDIYRGAIVLLMVMGFMRIVLNALFIFKANLSILQY
jgi:hypothetical protein